MTNYACHNIFIHLLRITLPKLIVKFQFYPLEIYWNKLEEVQKTH